MTATSRSSAAAFLLAAFVAVGCRTDPAASARVHVERGNEHFAAARYREATIEYRKALQQDAGLGQARHKLAQAHLRLGDPGAALAEYVRAADLMPRVPGVQLEAGSLLLLTGQFEEAKARANKVLEQEPRNAAALVLLANASLGLKDVETALRQVEQAISLDPRHTAGYAALGTIQFGRGSTSLAEGAFRKAVEIDGSSVEARLALANFYWATGRAPEAEAELEQIVEMSPRHPLGRRALALYYLAARRAADAEPHLKALVDLSQDSKAKLALADYYVATGRRQEARALLESLATGDTLAAAKIGMAAIAHAEGNHAAAHAALEEVLSRDPRHPMASLAKARLLLAEGRPGDALAPANAVVAANPQDIEAHFVLGRVYAARRDVERARQSFQEVLRLNPRAAGAHLELARLNLAQGRAQASVRFAQDALRHEPASLEARLMLARSLVAAGDATRAETEVAGLMKSSPGLAIVHALAGHVALQKGDPKRARSLFVKALEIDRYAPEALAGLLAVDAQTPAMAATVAQLDQRQAERPTDVGLLLLSARAHAASGDAERTERLLRRAIELNPSTTDAYALLGQLYVKRGNLDQAKREFEAWAGRDASTVVPHTMVGIIHQIQKNDEAARNWYEKALAVNSRSAVAANNLAWLYAEGGGNLDLALQLALVAHGESPDVPEYTDTLGWVYLKKGMFQQAAELFEQSVRKDPANAVYTFHLGLAHLKAGDGQKARRSLELALKMAPRFDGADEARKALESLDRLP